MTFVYVAIGIGVLIWLLTRGSSSARPNAASLPNASVSTSLSGDCFSLLQRGVPARGILLKVGSQRSARGTIATGLFEVRTVTMDVEIPGTRPYQCDCTLYVPARLCPLVLPGATLELRVDPTSRQNVAVYGPGVGLPSLVTPAR